MIPFLFRSLASFGGKFCFLFYGTLSHMVNILQFGFQSWSDGTASDQDQMDYDVNRAVKFFNEVFE